MSQQRNRRSTRNTMSQGFIPSREAVHQVYMPTDGYSRVSAAYRPRAIKPLFILIPLTFVVVIALVILLVSGGSSGQITLEKYNKLSEGMLYSDVVNIIGSPGTIENEASMFNSTMVTRQWIGNGGSDSKCVIMFTDDRIHMMMQTGLR